MLQVLAPHKHRAWPGTLLLILLLFSGSFCKVSSRHPSAPSTRLLELAKRQHTVQAPCSLCEDTNTDSIPHILHQVYLGGYQAWYEATQKPHARLQLSWQKSCMLQHPQWTYLFWDLADAEKLLAEKYPWFLGTFRSYEYLVEKGDAIRNFILHAFGGVYLDLDVECFRPGDDMLDGYDVVLQASMPAYEEVTNAMMASTPGHPFWEKTFSLLQERANFSTGVADIPYRTGPHIIEGGLQKTVGIKDNFAGEHVVDGGRVMVYPLGMWYSPCFYSEDVCMDNVRQTRWDGTTELEKLVGFHRYSNTWHPDW